MNGVIPKIHNAMSSMNSTEQKIASYLLENGTDLMRLPIADIAARCGTSQAALVRFCKRLNYKGLKDLKRALAEDMLENCSTDNDCNYDDISDADSIESILEKVCHNSIRSITDTQHIVDCEQLNRAISVIETATRVDFYGVGASGLVALDAQQKFIRIGKVCNASSDSHVQMVMASSLKQGDVAVFISNSGATRDTLETLHCAAERGATLIAITKFGGTPISREADISLCISSTESIVRSGATSSRIAQFIIIDTLFTGVAGRNLPHYRMLLNESYKHSRIKKVAGKSKFPR